MATPASVGIVVRMLVILTGCAGITAFVYTFAMDRYSSCFIHDRFLWWANVDFYINLATIAAWVFYKESWITGVIMTVLLICFTSMTTCVYIMVQFFMLSPEEASKDPLYYVLMTRKKRDVTGHRWGSSVVAARVIVSMVGCSMVGLSIYVFFVDGFPNPAKAFSPCVIGALIDNYGIITVLSVWIAYKESSYISAFIWIFLLLTNRSIITCVYIVWQLFRLSPRQPVSLILFNSIHKDLLSSDPLLEGVC